MKWCSVSQIWSKPSSSVPSLCSSSRGTTSAWAMPGAAWKKKNVPKRMSAPDACEVFQRGDDSGEILVAVPGRGGRRAELMRDARQRQRHAEALPLLQHEPE